MLTAWGTGFSVAGWFRGGVIDTDLSSVKARVAELHGSIKSIAASKIDVSETKLKKKKCQKKTFAPKKKKKKKKKKKEEKRRKRE